MNPTNEPLGLATFHSHWIHEISEKLVAAHLDPFFEEYELPILKLNALLHAYESNPDFKTAFTNWVISLRGKDAESATFDSSIRMVGIKKATHFLIACILGEKIPSKLLKRDPKTGLLPQSLEQTLIYAYKTQKTFADGTRYEEVAFPLGLFFDYLNYYHELHTVAEQKKKIESFIQNRFDHALKASQIALSLVKQREKMSRERDVLPLIFLESASQVIFALFDPTYIDFVVQCEKINLHSSLTYQAEIKKFKGHHTRLANSSLAALPQFSRLGAVLINLHTPYLLTEPQDQECAELASVVFLSFYLLRNQNTLSKITKPTNASELCNELKGFSQEIHFDLVFKKEV